MAALLAFSASGLSAAAQEAEEQESGIFALALPESGETVTLTNDTEETIADVIYTEEESGTEGSLLITEEDGTEHAFEDADLAEASDYDVIEKLSFFYVVGEDGEDEEFWLYENADEVELSEPVTMFVLADMNIREEADQDADIIGSADAGSEVEITGGTPIWFSVVSGDENGYIAARYLTEDQEEANEAAEAAAVEDDSETEQPETDQTETEQPETEQPETEQSGTDQSEEQTESAAEDDSDVNPYESDAGGYYYQVDGVWYEDVAPDSDAGGYYYQVDGEWYEDVAPDSDADGYFYYETADGRRYRILDPSAVSIGYDELESEFDDVDEDSDAGGYLTDIEGDVDPDASDAGY